MTERIAFQDTWPETPRLLWRLRHYPMSAYNLRFHATQRACPTCGHAYTPGHYRDHLRSVAHREMRGWWR